MYGDLKKCEFWLLVICAYSCMLGQGFIDNTRSVTYPLMKTDLHLSYTEFGGLQSMAQFSYLFWSLAVAMSLQKLGFKLVIVLSFLMSISGCILTAFSNNYVTVFMYQFLACAGMGALDDCPHALSSILFKKNTGLLMLLLHSCYGLGAVFGPIFAAFVKSKLPKYSFRGISFLMSVPLSILCLFILFVPFAIKKPQKEEMVKEKKGHTVWSALVSPMVWLQALILVLMTTGERATSAWGGLYLEDVLHLDPAKEGAWFNSCFYIAFTTARLVGGLLVDWLGPFCMEYIVLTLSMVIFAVGLSIGKAGVYVLPFAGCTVAFFWPTFIVICMRYWKEDAAVPISCILPMQASLGIPIQLFLGWLNDRYGHGTAYWSTVPTIGIALVLLIIFHFILLRKEKRESSEAEKGLLESSATVDVSAAVPSGEKL